MALSPGIRLIALNSPRLQGGRYGIHRLGEALLLYVLTPAVVWLEATSTDATAALRLRRHKGYDSLSQQPIGGRKKG
jgi:hypothetical protein